MRWIRRLKLRVLAGRLDAILADLERIHDAVWAADRNYGPIGGSGDRPERPNPAWLREASLRRYNLRRSPLRLHLREEAGHVVAYAVAEDFSNFTQLTHLVVDPEHQGKGHGKALMRKVMQDTRHASLRLACFAFNERALGFYRSFDPGPSKEVERGGQFFFEYETSV